LAGVGILFQRHVALGQQQQPSLMWNRFNTFILLPTSLALWPVCCKLVVMGLQVTLAQNICIYESVYWVIRPKNHYFWHNFLPQKWGWFFANVMIWFHIEKLCEISDILCTMSVVYTCGMSLIFYVLSVCVKSVASLRVCGGCGPHRATPLEGVTPEWLPVNN
jgi:hypothetical protein